MLLLPARRGTRRSDESAAEGDAPGQNPAWLRDRAEKQFAGNRVLHPIPGNSLFFYIQWIKHVFFLKIDRVFSSF